MWHQPIQGAFRSWSWLVTGAFLCCGLVAPAGCGRSESSGASPATGGAQASGGNVGSGGAPGTGGAGTGGTGTGGAGTGGQAGTAGPGVDPAVSAAWQWAPCGTLPPTVVSATAIAYAPLTEELVAAYENGRVILHSVDPAKADRVLSEAAPPPTAIAFSPNGKLLAEARGAGVSLRRLQDGQVLVTTDGTGGACGTPTQLGFSPDGSRLLGRSAGAICVWRTDSAALVAMATEAFTAAALTNSSVVVGRRLSTGGLAVEALALPSLTRTTIPVQLAAAPALTDPDTLVISPAGDSFVAVVRTDTDRSLMLWDGAGATLVTRPLGESRPVVFFSRWSTRVVERCHRECEYRGHRTSYSTPGGVSGGPVPAGDVEWRWHATGGLERDRYAQGARRL